MNRTPLLRSPYRESPQAAIGPCSTDSAGATREAVSKASPIGERLAIAAYPLAALGGLALGGLLSVLSAGAAAQIVWAGTVAVMLLPLSWTVARALRGGELGVDLIALIAMAGALALGEYLAGAVIALMLAGGNALERFASARARRALTALVDRVPRLARRRAGSGWEEVPVDEVAVGELLLIRPGEVLPADGELLGERAVIDESSMTGEPLPATYARGHTLAAGTVNAGEAFELRVERRTQDSAYAALVRLVAEAEQRKAPFVRMADRYATFFLPLTVVIAAAAWALSAQPVRALAVFVVATPCPLILAAPIAFVAGLSRAAKTGVIVKGGAALEALARTRTVLLDKTGTLTLGVPAIERILALGEHGEQELLRLAASLDQLSSHVLARSIVREAARQHLALARPSEASESPGEGVQGVVSGSRIVVGSRDWLAQCGVRLPPDRELPRARPGNAAVLVGVDGSLAGALLMADRLRPDAGELVSRLRELGVRHVALLSGDRPRGRRGSGPAPGHRPRLRRRESAREACDRHPPACRSAPGTGGHGW
ncbi:MAG TPA: heavy metal translocating P-type ATPase [Solirubrobacteraceae bacterium]|nr:heavy metal translocating P-type ATPase [Solirubrobacteraceae bacterium]